MLAESSTVLAQTSPVVAIVVMAACVPSGLYFTTIASRLPVRFIPGKLP